MARGPGGMQAPVNMLWGLLFATGNSGVSLTPFQPYKLEKIMRSYK